MGLPILYQSTETNFSHLGLGILTDTVSCIVTEERNGIFELEMEYPITGVHFRHIKPGQIVKADAGHKLKGQLFEIQRVTENSNGKAQIYAQHVSYATKYLVAGVAISLGGTAQQALSKWSTMISHLTQHPFQVWSNIITEQDEELIFIDKYLNARNLLGGIDGSILSRWQGEYEFDNYNIRLWEERGKKANTIIAYGRNLITLEQEECIANTYNAVYPYVRFHGDREWESIGGWRIIKKQNFHKFSQARIEAIDCTDYFQHLGIVNLNRLEELVGWAAYSKAKPEVNLTLSFVDLSKVLHVDTGTNTMEEINLCDTVNVYFEHLDVKTEAKVVRIEWNVLKDRYESIQLGSIRDNVGSQIRRIDSLANDLANLNQRVNGL